MGQRLPPGVEDGEEAEFAEMPGIGGNDLERLGGRFEQARIELPLVLIGDLGRHGEHDMEVRYWQQIDLTVGEPAIARGPLPFGAMAVAATNGHRPLVALWADPVMVSWRGDAGFFL